MKFNIQYPPLVEQAYNFLIANGLQVKKDQVYKQLVESNILDENGNPTQEAIKAGFISEASKDDLIHRFKAENPLFTHMADKHFKVVNGEVAVDKYAIKQAAKTVLKDPAASTEDKTNAQSLLDRVKNI